MPRPKDIVDHARVRVHVYEITGKDDKGKDIVQHDQSRSMLLPKTDYKKNAKFFGPVLEEIPAGKEPKPWTAPTE